MDFHIVASRSSRLVLVTRAAVPSTTTSSPERSWVVPVVRTQRGSDSRFLAFCSWEPAQKCSIPSAQIAGSGVTCGRPSRRTVDSQNISEADSARATSAHGGAVAPGWLNASFNCAVGSVSGIKGSLGC